MMIHPDLLGAGHQTMMGFGFLPFLIPAAASMLGKLFHHGNSSQQQAQHGQQAQPGMPGMPQGATLKDLMPMLMPLLQHSQQAANQNYALQQRRYLMTDPGAASLMGPGVQAPEGALPLQQMVMRMTSNILPHNMRHG